MKCIQKLPGGGGQGQFVPDHLRQTGVSAQAPEILRAFAPSGIENDEALDERGFVVVALLLLHAHVVLHTLEQSQGAEGLDHQRDSPQRGQSFFQGLGINFE
ncbi:MAG: hypothetical protein ABSF71_20035 [Terriglobia bacterium]